MAVITHNIEIADGVYIMRVANITGGAGQFYMLRPDNGELFLGRPISVMDSGEFGCDFLYRVVGKGTGIMAKLRAGDAIFADGAYGNGFPLTEGNAVLIGGGMGVAPMHHLAKKLRENGAKHITMYAGFPDVPVITNECEDVCDRLIVNIGGYITDDVDYEQDAVYYTCGPTLMMKTAASRARRTGRKLYISLESRMACGAGACLGCSCETVYGNKRVCKDGPVFLAEEVVGYDK